MKSCFCTKARIIKSFWSDSERDHSCKTGRSVCGSAHLEETNIILKRHTSWFSPTTVWQATCVLKERQHHSWWGRRTCWFYNLPALVPLIMSEALHTFFRHEKIWQEFGDSCILCPNDVNTAGSLSLIFSLSWKLFIFSMQINLFARVGCENSFWMMF